MADERETINRANMNRMLADFIGCRVMRDDVLPKIWGVDASGGLQMIADVRGWGAIQRLFLRPDHSLDSEMAELFQDELVNFIVDAINEKLDTLKTESNATRQSSDDSPNDQSGGTNNV